MEKNNIGREVPENIGTYTDLKAFQGAWDTDIVADNNKLVDSLEEVIDKLELKDGMILSFHHHFREGDVLLNQVLDIIAERGIKDLTLIPSSLTNVHSDIIKHIKNGVITNLNTSGLRGELGKAISEGLMDEPVIIRSHGGRAGAIERGRVKIDVAFIAAPTADKCGNLNGTCGGSACGALGYINVDARHADKVVAVTDNLVDFPASPISIPQRLVDYVVKVDLVGHPDKIAKGALRKTDNPKSILIANKVVELINSLSFYKEGFSIQTGSGSISLATLGFLKDKMKEDQIKGSFLLGGITGGHVDLIEEGLFSTIFDTQTFDRVGIKSMRDNENHIEIDASDYANPFNKAPLVNNLDCVILSALEIDTNFNVNVITGSDGVLRGASGGHSDTAAGADISIIVAPSIRGRIPTIKDQVTTVVTPGESVDILVTERGICINPKRQDLLEELRQNSNLPIMDIKELQAEVETITGKPNPIKFKDNIVALVEYRDGTIIDTVREVAE